MKKVLPILLLCLISVFLTACDGLTDRNSIVSMFRKNEPAFIEAAAGGDFKALEKIDGVREVYNAGSYVDIICGGAGFGPSTHYYGIFYSEKDDLYAAGIYGGSADKLEAWGSGYRYKQPDGDNEYYVEPLGHHYYYHEEHY